MTISLEASTKRNGAELQEIPEIALTLPGIPAAISVVRSVIAQALTDCPCTDEVALVGCEYATNAIRHSPSGLPGGVFTMRIWAWPGRVRLEIIDSGSGDWRVAPESSEPSPDAESGRGLNVVAAIADTCGNCGCCAWAEMAWPEPPTGRPPGLARRGAVPPGLTSEVCEEGRRRPKAPRHRGVPGGRPPGLAAVSPHQAPADQIRFLA